MNPSDWFYKWNPEVLDEIQEQERIDELMVGRNVMLDELESEVDDD